MRNIQRACCVPLELRESMRYPSLGIQSSYNKVSNCDFNSPQEPPGPFRRGVGMFYEGSWNLWDTPDNTLLCSVHTVPIAIQNQYYPLGHVIRSSRRTMWPRLAGPLWRKMQRRSCQYPCSTHSVSWPPSPGPFSGQWSPRTRTCTCTWETTSIDANRMILSLHNSTEKLWRVWRGCSVVKTLTFWSQSAWKHTGLYVCNLHWIQYRIISIDNALTGVNYAPVGVKKTLEERHCVSSLRCV